MEENAGKYSDQCSRLPKDLKEWQAYRDLKNYIDTLKEQLPLIISLKKPSIMPRHWDRIKEITNTKLNYENPEQFYIEEIMAAKLLDFREDVEDITESADKQLKIRTGLDEINLYWNDMVFAFNTWGKRDTPCIL